MTQRGKSVCTPLCGCGRCWVLQSVPRPIIPGFGMCSGHPSSPPGLRVGDLHPLCFFLSLYCLFLSCFSLLHCVSLHPFLTCALHPMGVLTPQTREETTSSCTRGFTPCPVSQALPQPCHGHSSGLFSNISDFRSRNETWKLFSTFRCGVWLPELNNT